MYRCMYIYIYVSGSGYPLPPPMVMVPLWYEGVTVSWFPHPLCGVVGGEEVQNDIYTWNKAWMGTIMT